MSAWRMNNIKLMQQLQRCARFKCKNCPRRAIDRTTPCVRARILGWYNTLFRTQTLHQHSGCITNHQANLVATFRDAYCTDVPNLRPVAVYHREASRRMGLAGACILHAAWCCQLAALLVSPASVSVSRVLEETVLSSGSVIDQCLTCSPSLRILS